MATPQKKMDGPPPENLGDRVARLEDELASIKALMRRNGWTVKD